ncbi:DEAD/DEAH box helicase [Alicyclobacillus curvatus]|nr:DEAD/DEAH box helicase [Alicyclobacillus curvatus]
MGRRIKGSSQLELDLFDGVEMKRLREENGMLRAVSQRLQKQNAELIDEISRLKRLVWSSALNNAHVHVDSRAGAVAEDSFEPNTGTHFRSVTKVSHIEDKIALFRSYFKGREDVYAVRAANTIGKVPYYPKRQYLRKENGKIQWGDYLPLTDEVIQAHLQDDASQVTIGIYPLLMDEKCWFLAIDLDKTSWKEDTAVFLETCQTFNIPTALERSRSGNGGHVWIFFAEPLPARTARLLGTRLLTRTVETRHQIGLDSYDRMFPSQDTSPKGKHLGNLIALPLQRVPAKEGHSLFIDEEHVPYPDQWVFLASLGKMTRDEVEDIVCVMEQFGDLIAVPEPSTGEEDDTPWDRPQKNILSRLLPEPLPKKIRIVLADLLYVEKQGLSSPQINTFIHMAAFQNPEFYKAQAMRMPTYNKPRVIDCSEELHQYITLPRGRQEEVISLLRSQDVPMEIEDRRNPGTPTDVTFHGQLRVEQQHAVQNLQQYDIGTLSATTAFGKTVVAAWMITERATNTLILVDKTQLMEQWVERLSALLKVPKNEIGIIGGGKQKRTGWIDVALFQSVYVNKEVKDFVAEYGHVIVDECHHVSAVSFEQVLKRVKAKYVLGLTATLTRKDGKHPIVLMQCGPVRFKTDARMQAKTRPFQQVVIPRNTDFKLPDSDGEIPIQQLYALLSQDESRNDMIFDDLLKALERGRSPIFLTDRVHLEYFENRLKGFATNIIVLRGGMGKKQRQTTQERILFIPADAERLILATGRFVGEGFDDARLDTLFLAMPISWKGTVQQYAGRLHRLYEPKQEVQIMITWISMCRARENVSEAAQGISDDGVQRAKYRRSLNVR